MGYQRLGSANPLSRPLLLPPSPVMRLPLLERPGHNCGCESTKAPAVPWQGRLPWSSSLPRQQGCHLPLQPASGACHCGGGAKTLCDGHGPLRPRPHQQQPLWLREKRPFSPFSVEEPAAQGRVSLMLLSCQPLLLLVLSPGPQIILAAVLLVVVMKTVQESW